MNSPILGEELVHQAIGGDTDALCQLLERHGPEVRRRFQTRIPRRWQSLLTIDDLMQETYTDAFLDVGEFAPRGEHSFERWLYTIAKNNLLGAIKLLEAQKRGGKRQRVELGGSGDSFVVLHDLLSGSITTPSGQAARHEATAKLTDALSRLPDAYRMVVLMYDIEGAPLEAICEALGRQAGAVFMLRARAHRALRRLMGTPSDYLSGGA